MGSMVERERMMRWKWTRIGENADKMLGGSEIPSFKAEQILCASIHEINSSVIQRLSIKTSNNIS